MKPVLDRIALLYSAQQLNDPECVPRFPDG